MEVVRVLLDRGADINQARNDGQPPLFIASFNGRVDVVRVLVERGADINQAANDGVTPLMAARLNNHPEVVRLLVQHAVAARRKSSRKE